MQHDVDVLASAAAVTALLAVLLANMHPAAFAERRLLARVAREEERPLISRGSMEAVYRAVIPFARACIALGISANAVTIASFGLASIAAVLFGLGHFGIGAAVAIVATIADAIDGLVARETHTETPFGKVLDTTVDRYVDAALFGGIAMYVRHDAWLLGLVLVALVAGFMVSYASSVLRELGVTSQQGAMRRAERVVYVVGGALLVPFTSLVVHGANMYVQLAPLLVALALIAVIGNVSAVKRLVLASRPAPSRASVHTYKAHAYAKSNHPMPIRAPLRAPIRADEELALARIDRESNANNAE